VITAIMAFGSGVLIATLTFSILVEAFNVTHTLPATAIGLILGGVSYSIANLILDRKSKSKTSKNVYANRSDSKIASDKNSASGRCFYIVSKHPFFGIS
jgi:zinc transporter, ZIP family